MEKNEKLIEEKGFEIEVLIDLETETVTSGLMKTIQKYNHQRSDEVGREWDLLSWTITDCKIENKDTKKIIKVTIAINMRNKCFFDA